MDDAALFEFAYIIIGVEGVLISWLPLLLAGLWLGLPIDAGMALVGQVPCA